MKQADHDQAFGAPPAIPERAPPAPPYLGRSRDGLTGGRGSSGM